MTRLDLNMKVRELIISDRKAYNQEIKHLERWLVDVEDCKRMMVQCVKNLCKIIDSNR